MKNNSSNSSAKNLDKEISPYEEQLLIGQKNLRNTECPITYEPIKYGDIYKTCGNCEWNFSNEILEEMFNKTCNRKCPMCRGNWYISSNIKTYINKSSKKEKEYQEHILNCKIQKYIKNYDISTIEPELKNIIVKMIKNNKIDMFIQMVNFY